MRTGRKVSVHVPQSGPGGRIAQIDEHGNANGFGHQLMQECQPLGDQLHGKTIVAGRVTGTITLEALVARSYKVIK
jgi:hypothetical protein